MAKEVPSLIQTPRQLQTDLIWPPYLKLHGKDVLLFLLHLHQICLLQFLHPFLQGHIMNRLSLMWVIFYFIELPYLWIFYMKCYANCTWGHRKSWIMFKCYITLGILCSTCYGRNWIYASTKKGKMKLIGFRCEIFNNVFWKAWSSNSCLVSSKAYFIRIVASKASKSFKVKKINDYYLYAERCWLF